MIQFHLLITRNFSIYTLFKLVNRYFTYFFNFHNQAFLS